MKDFKVHDPWPGIDYGPYDAERVERPARDLRGAFWWGFGSGYLSAAASAIVVWVLVLVL